MSNEHSPGTPDIADRDSFEKIYSTGLRAIASIAILLAFIRISIDTCKMLSNAERPVDATSLGLLAAAALAFLLLRVGPLLRLKWGTAEVEFSNLAGAVRNSAEVTSKDIAARVEELKSVIEKALGPEGKKASTTLREKAGLDDPPALLRSIIYPDDLWKGRFGGKASSGDYSLSASFRKQPRSQVVELHLAVTSSNAAKSARTVEFFIHPSFPRERIKVRMVQGKAELDLLAWGGFTVGVWIAEYGIELELDLAEIPSAPKIIREE